MKRATGFALIVVCAVALATGLTEASFALGAELSFEWYLAAVACVAWRCGRRAALATTIASSAVLDFFFLPVHGLSLGMGLTDAGRLLVFLGVALLVTHLVSARKLAEEERVWRERLLVTVAHELGNMIFALRTWTTALKRQQLPGEQLDNAARALVRTTDSIARLAGDLMDWSHIASGTLDLQPEDLDLAEVVEDAIHEMRARAAELGVKLSWSLEQTRVRADRHRLHQVALNLLTNSLKATRPGGEVIVSVQPADHRGLFSVRDTGLGISPQLLPRIFEPSTPRSRSSGLGVGLALSRDIIRAQGGDLTVHSGGLGTGATFSIDLPAASATQPRWQ